MIAYLRPSTAHAWRRCAGFARLNSVVRALPDADNDVREDGTATHWLAQQGWNVEDAVFAWKFPATGTISPNGRPITDELVRGAEEYLDVLASWGSPQFTFIESQLPTGVIFPGTQNGTPDAYHVSPYSTLGRLADLKMGFKPVEVWRNDQLTVYGWTILMLHPHLTELEFTIVQPRAAHHDGTVRTWRVGREELREQAVQLQQAALNAHVPDPLCTVNPACGNCGAAHACRTLQAAGGTGVDTSYESTPHELTPQQLGYELLKLMQAAEHMQYRINGLSAQADSIIMMGKRVPGFARERKATRYRWRDEKVPELEQLARLLGVDIHAPEKPRTPAQLRGALPGLDELLALYAERPTGELTLKPVDPTEAIRAFTQRK